MTQAATQLIGDGAQDHRQRRRPRARAARAKALLTGHGRGHLIMEALADDVDINLDQGGTVVTLQFADRAQLP